MNYQIRKAKWSDREQIYALYRLVAQESDGLARRAEEISLNWIESILQECSESGLFLLLEDIQTSRIDGLIHASGNTVFDLRHVMGSLTFLIRPQFQGVGLGKYLFRNFLKVIFMEFPHIQRVELRTRSSNQAAIRLYESLGFQQEGIFRLRIRNRSGELEDGIPMVWFRDEQFEQIMKQQKKEV